MPALTRASAATPSTKSRRTPSRKASSAKAPSHYVWQQLPTPYAHLACSLLHSLPNPHARILASSAYARLRRLCDSRREALLLCRRLIQDDILTGVSADELFDQSRGVVRFQRVTPAEIALAAAAACRKRALRRDGGPTAWADRLPYDALDNRLYSRARAASEAKRPPPRRTYPSLSTTAAHDQTTTATTPSPLAAYQVAVEDGGITHSHSRLSFRRQSAPQPPPQRQDTSTPQAARQPVRRRTTGENRRNSRPRLEKARRFCARLPLLRRWAQ